MRRGGSVDVAAPVAVVYDYLVEPLNRPQWQSSLRRVEVADSHRRGTTRTGTAWVDVTWPGLRPRMRLSEAERPHRWAEVGHWRRIEAELVLGFTAIDTGTRIEVSFEVRLPGRAARFSDLVTRAVTSTVLADLRRAAQLLER